MLKIEDNVDLKELEKFGFKLIYKDTGNINITWKEYTKYFTNGSDNNRDDFKIIINHNSRLISIQTIPTYEDWGVDDVEFEFNELDIIYDLIKADIVEKVEE